MKFEEGMIVYLKEPYLGSRAVRLLEKSHYKWTVEIVGSGKQIQFYEDEFEID